MKKSVLITGASGSGKSEVGRKLQNLGHEVYDIDSTPNLCVMIDKNTGIPTDYDNRNDVEKIQKMLWICKKDVLQSIIKNQKNNIAFYCGLPNNYEEISDCFSDTIVLVVSPDIIIHRLIERRDNGFGKSKEVQEYILAGKTTMERFFEEKGATMIDGDQDIDRVVQEVLSNS